MFGFKHGNSQQLSADKAFWNVHDQNIWSDPWNTAASQAVAVDRSA